MNTKQSQQRPTLGVLAGWQFYRTATNLSYLAPIFRGAVRSAQQMGCNLLLGCGMGPSASPADPLRPAWPLVASDSDFIPIGPYNTDGLIVLVPTHSQARSAYIQGLMKDGHPILFVGSGEDGPTLAVNNRRGILEAMNHLVAHGHRRIAFIAESLADMRGDSGERLNAYQDGLAFHGLDQDARLLAYGRHVYDGGYLAMQQILQTRAPFTAVIASNDESALGAMQALREDGRRIPQDVAVIGFDNRLEGSAHDPSLSSVHIPLYNMGYQAVELLLHAIRGESALPERVQIDTHLVIRESCGCLNGIHLESTAVLSASDPSAQLVNRMASLILNEAHSLTHEEGAASCQLLLDTFVQSIEQGDKTPFKAALSEVLQRTAAGQDDTHVWQAAVSVMGQVFDESSAHPAPSARLIHDLLSEARLTISQHMRRQHRDYVIAERWTSSRLSLLNARLLTALDEQQIYAILAEHCPVMGIPITLLGLFEGEGNPSETWIRMRDILNPARDLKPFRGHDFRLENLFEGQDHPLILTLIPLVDQSGQIGFMVFDSEQLDLYGFIVQQVGGALNTARLYREANEGRRLAEAANRMKSRFLSTISHELRTPLNLIVGLSGMVLRASDEDDVLLPGSTRQDVERIHAYSQHLGGLIGDVIDLATSDAGELRLNSGYVDLTQALCIVAESGKLLAADKGLMFEVIWPDKPLWVWGDTTRLRQIALNLVNNAIKFTTHGKVSLRLEAEGQFITVTVQDTGLGIPPSEHQAIFDEFRQSDRSVALGYGGLGLGLAISKRLVDMHGGTISVASTGEEGLGSVFSFRLPQVSPALSQASPVEDLPRPQQVVAVLTKTPNTCEHLCLHLEQRNLQVSVAIVDKTLNWQSQIIQQHADAIVLDISSDAAFGWNTLKEIRYKPSLASIPVFFFSSAQSESALLELDYLTKPIELSELTVALDQHWSLANPQQPGRNVLVVDDEPRTLEMHAMIVQSHSSANRVLKARNGQEALDILRREIVDLILLDLQMPLMDGFEMLEAMRALDSLRHIPVIVVTGKVLTESDMSRLNEGVAAVLAKGLFSIEETISHISSALEHKRKLSEEARRLVRLAMGYIHRNFAEPISRGDIARQIGISEDHLTFCFRKELGTTPMTYLQRYRVQQAKSLLKNSQQTITDIALSVGFSDSGYFSRIFHRETGLSPEAFRRS